MKLQQTPLLSSNIQAQALKMNECWKKNKHDFLSIFEKVRQPSELEVKFLLKFDQGGERKVADLPPKEPQTKLAPEWDRNNMTMMMMTIMTLIIILGFLHPKEPQTGLVTGGLIKFDNEDDLDDNDDDDDDSDDNNKDDDDESDVNDFFKTLFYRIIVFEAPFK